MNGVKYAECIPIFGLFNIITTLYNEKEPLHMYHLKKYIYISLLRVRMLKKKVSLQTKLNAGLSEQEQEDLFQNERSFHEVKL